jgi:hypothetical protein
MTAGKMPALQGGEAGFVGGDTEFGGEFEFDGGVEGEGVGADGGAGVFAGVAEDGGEEFGSAVGDFGLGVEAVGALDEDGEAEDLADLVDVALAGVAEDGEGVEGAEAGGGGGLFDGDGVGTGPAQVRVPSFMGSCPETKMSWPPPAPWERVKGT